MRRRPPHGLIRPLITASLVLAVLISAPVVRAVSLAWINAAGGSAGVAANWSPAQVPTAADAVSYSSLVGTLSIFIPAAIDSVAWLSMTSGAAILDIEGTHTSPRGVEVNGAVATTRLRIASGTLISDTLLGVSGNVGTRGTLEVDSPSSHVIALRNFIPGASGLGIVTVTNGASIEVGNLIQAGQASASRCTVRVSGVSSSPAQRSRLAVTGFGSITRIGSLGTAVFDIRDGAEMTCAGTLAIGQGLPSNGVLRVGSTTANRSRVGATGQTSLSGTGSGTGGRGLLEVQSGGTVELGAQIRVGPSSGGGTGTLRIQDGGEVIAGNGLLLRPLTGGSLDLQGGTLRVIDGALLLGGLTPLTLSSATGTPELWLSNGLLTTLTAPLATQPALVVGASGAGRLRVSESGSRVGIATGTLLAGRGIGSSGTLLADSLGVIEVLGPVTLGDSGAAAARVTAGGVLKTAALQLGANGTGAGRVDVEGAGSRLEVSGPLSLGGTSAGANGSGVLRVRDGGVVQTITPFPDHLRIWGAGDTLAVGTGGSVVTFQQIDVGGVLSMEGGSISGAQVELTGTGVVEGHGTLRGRVHGVGGSTTVRVSPGAAGSQRLVIGDSLRTDGYAMEGLTQVDADTIVVLDQDGADLANTTLSGGVLELPKGGRIVAGSQLSGAGVVTGDLLLDGSIQTTGTGDGIAFAGKLTSLDRTILGLRLRILPTGRFSGFGSSEVRLTNDGHVDMGPAPRRLTLTRPYIQTSTGTLHIRLGSEAGGLQDTLVSTGGSTTLAGTLALSAIPGDEPAVGDTFIVLQRSSGSGTFASVTWSGPPGTDAQVSYSSNQVRVAIVAAIVGVPAREGAVRELRLAATGVPHRTALSLDLPVAAEVTLTLFDVAGRVVAPMHAGRLEAGSHRFGLENRGLASGVYFARALIASPEGTRVLHARVVTTRD